MAQTPAPDSLFKILFSLEGRIRRRTLGAGVVGIYGSAWGTYLLADYYGGVISLVPVAILLFGRWWSIALLVKRMKDYDRTPSWLVFTMPIPLLGQIVEVILLFEGLTHEGTVGPNQFGFDPRGRAAPEQEGSEEKIVCR
jgi:uncharacterized membrane protein YhaH (DUF805 family)